MDGLQALLAVTVVAALAPLIVAALPGPRVPPSGMTLDVQSIIAAPLRLFVFFILLLVVRGLPSLLVYRRALPLRQRVEMTFITATTMPLMIALAVIGLINDLLERGRGLDLVERPVGDAELGAPVRDVAGAVIAVVRGNEVLASNDPRATPLARGDRLILVSSPNPP